MENLLKQTFLNHTDKVSDKWTLYINEWDSIFSPYRDLPINLFEIGIQNGGSLEIWAKYFKNAQKIVGCDIDEKCRELKFADPRITLFIGDANSDEIQKQVLESAPKYDVIIDDGSHRSSDVIRSFCRYYPYLEYDGIYVIEDLHTSYWEEFEGSLFNPASSMSFLKHLADIVNHEHWRNNQARINFLSEFSDYLQISFTEEDLLSIHSIEFVNSLCIVKKRRPDENVLGRRIVVGSEELVTIGLAKLDGTHIQDFSMAIKDDSELNVSNLVKNLDATNHSVEILTVDLGKKEQLISDLGKGLEDEKLVTERLRANLAGRGQELEKLTTDLVVRDQALEKLTTDLVVRDQTQETLTTTLAERDQALEKLTVNLAMRDKELEKLTADLAMLDQEQENLTTSLAERDQALGKLQIALTESQKEVVEYTRSTSWRMTRPFRKISKFLQGNNDDPNTTAS